MAVIELAPEYGLVMVVAAITCLHCLLQGIPIGRLRSRFFTKEFFAENFPGLKDYPKGGYPDMGSGKFSEKLTLEQWQEFNNAQRAHQNYLEFLPATLLLEAFSGLFYPRLTAIAGLAILLGRVLYGIGYRSKGPSGRLLGAFISEVALLVILAATIYGAFQHAGGAGAWVRLFESTVADVKAFAAPYLK